MDALKVRWRAVVAAAATLIGAVAIAAGMTTAASAAPNTSSVAAGYEHTCTIRTDATPSHLQIQHCTTARHRRDLT